MEWAASQEITPSKRLPAPTQWCPRTPSAPKPLRQGRAHSAGSFQGRPSWRCKIMTSQNKTIKDGDTAPWKDLKRFEQKKRIRNNFLIWGGLSSVSIFFTSNISLIICRTDSLVFYWLSTDFYWHYMDFYWLSLVFYLLSTDFYWLSTDSLLTLYWISTDFYYSARDLLSVWTIENSWKHSKLYVGLDRLATTESGANKWR